MGQTIAAARVGFVGVRGGLAYPQFRALCRLLIDRDIPGAVTGVGTIVRGTDGWGDRDFDRIARWMTPTPELVIQDAAPTPDGLEPTHAARNRAIVDGCDLLVACPPVPVEEPRSRTWQAVRHARRIGRPVVLVYPDGTVDPGPRPYFLVIDPTPVRPVLVFLARDPRADGLHLLDVTPVLLETLPVANRAGGAGTATARPVLGRSTAGPLRYREFTSRKALARAGFAPAGRFRVCDSWDDYKYPWPAPAVGSGETEAPVLQAETDLAHGHRTPLPMGLVNRGEQLDHGAAVGAGDERGAVLADGADEVADL